MDEQNTNSVEQQAQAPGVAPQVVSGGNKNISLLLLVLGALAIAGGLLYWLQQSEETMQLPFFTPRESVAPTLEADLSADLNQAEPTDVDNEFETIDAEINGL